MAYKTPVYVCEKCGEKIEGDMPIISHTILGCGCRCNGSTITPIVDNKPICSKCGKQQFR